MAATLDTAPQPIPATQRPGVDLLATPVVTLPVPQRGLVRRHRSSQAGTPAPSDEVARARAKRARERQEVELAVEHRLDDLETTDVLSVPRMYVVVTGSLAPAAALQLIAQKSERQYQITGSSWVKAPAWEWIYRSGLSQEDWVRARSALRDLGLIQERRRYDMRDSAIVTEFAFMLDEYSNHVAKVRKTLRELAWSSMKTSGTANLL